MFDAVLLVDRESHARVAGMTILERAAFTMARAGAQRLLCVGDRPPTPPRLPALPVTWISADPAAPRAQPGRASDTAIVMEAAAVVDSDTLAALAEAPISGTLRVAGTVGLWRCSAASLPETLRSAPEPGHASWVPPRDFLLLRVDDRSSRVAAERALYARLGRAGDGWITRHVDRRISRGLTRLLLPAGVSPNQVTLASVAVGLTAALLFAAGTREGIVAGSLLFLLSTIVDGCDGEIARLTFRESELGAYLDLVGDNVVHVALFGGIAIGIHRQAPDDRTVATLGVLMVTGVLVAMTTAYWSLVRRRPTRGQRALFDTFASREFAYLLVALALADKLTWFLWAAACGTFAFAAGLLLLGALERPMTLRVMTAVSHIRTFFACYKEKR